MENKLYTTGEAVGMTRVPLKSIQRYIKLFPDGFSEAARITSRGRRYTGGDLKAVLLIRHLNGRNATREKISAALAGEWTPDSLPWHDIDSMMQVTQEARSEIGKIKTYVSKAQEIKRFMDNDAWAIRKRIGEMFETIQRQGNKINELSSQVDNLARVQQGGKAKKDWKPLWLKD